MNNISKKNYAWLIGFICMVLALALFLNYGFNLNWHIDKSWVGIVSLYYILIFIGAIVGLIRGIKEVKDRINILSILGIILCVLAALVSIFIGYWMVIAIFASTT
ncbi:MAG: hypothetical protein V1825_00010 [Candidatus Falkowbacteria bacterium]